MGDIAKGWYPDPADRSVQRYWDGEGWIGDPLPVDATPGDAPPAVKPAAPPAPAPAAAEPTTTAPPATTTAAPPGGPPPSAPPPGTFAPGALPPGAPPPGALPPGTYGPYRYPVGMIVAPRPHGHPLAPRFARLVARIIDTLVLLALNVVVNAWLAYQFWQEFRPFLAQAWQNTQAGVSTPPEALSTRASWLFLAMLGVTVALWFAYEVPAMANTGQTLGKRLMAIKVVRLESTEPLGFRRAWRRWNRLGLPVMLWSCYGVGFLLQFIDCLFVAIDRPLHQALHDRAAATVVVGAAPHHQGGGA
jgi:uncharacterized RDD family membrane protein YckC